MKLSSAQSNHAQATRPQLAICGLLWLCGAIFLLTSQAAADDWPMWRYDSNRSAAASTNRLPDKLTLLWNRSGTPRVQAWDDPLNLDLMTYDRISEPIVLDGRMFIGHSDRDKVSAIDLATGQALWSFYTDAPVRLPPAGFAGRVYFTSDDGRLYCVDAETGTLHWQFNGSAGPRKVIGNQRLISAWPARGGVVIRDGDVYFASSIWPFMGVFIYSLDAESGAVNWVNDSAGASYIKQPHSAPSFAGVAPQGALVATDEHLIVPGGRSVPAVFDRKTGDLRYFELNAGGKGTGGSFVIANDSVFFVHTRQKGVREFNLAKGDKTAFMPNEPVLDGDAVYTAETAKDGSPVIRRYDAKRKVTWEVAADGRGDLILAGDKLYAAGPTGITAIALPTITSGSDGSIGSDNPTGQQSSPRITWTAAADPKIERLLAADGKLIAVTSDGNILVYGADSGQPVAAFASESAAITLNDESALRAERAFQIGQAQGYALWFGAADESMIDAVATKSPFSQLAIIDGDRSRVDRLRQRLDQAGLYGKVTVHHDTPVEFDAAPYVAHMIFVAEELSQDLARDSKSLRALYESVRPYGGVLQLLAAPSLQPEIASLCRDAKLEQAMVEISEGAVVIRKEGALPGSADWTHQHGDIGNTRKSNDSRVKLPLGVLWFGGSSNADILPRHGHGPPQQVVDGRLFVQGIDMLSARDVYTGRVLWKRKFDNLGTFDVYYDATYKDSPLETAYNQVHIPGANARGTNFVATADRIYIVEGAVCRVLDPATGESIQDIALPQDDPDHPADWSYIGIYEDILIGGLGFARYRDRLSISFEEEDGKLSGSKAGFGSKSLDRAGSLALVGFDRLTGKQLWRVDARHSFWNNAIVAGSGKVYCLDRNPKTVEDKLRRRGTAVPDNYRLLAFDAKTGKTQWQVEQGIFGTWLGYSEQFDHLLQAGAAASDRLSVETDRGMTVYSGKDGSVKWTKPDLKYSGPCILHNDLIITNANSYSQSAGAFYLATGEPQMITNPLTGVSEQWKLSRSYGCNTILASENMLTFRSGAAGFYDLTSHSGTGNFGGFKSGCTGNLIAAGGVLNAPDYTRTCSCSYQNQTSLALVHMPEVETWTVNEMTKVSDSGRRVQSLGINFGAPGQRRSPDGILWIESPSSATEKFPLDINVQGDTTLYQRHSSALSTSEYPWVFASGIEGEVTVHIGTVFTSPKSEKTADTKQTDKTKSPDDDGATKSEAALIPPADALAYRIRLFFAAPNGGADSRLSLPQASSIDNKALVEGEANQSSRVFDVLVNESPVFTNVTLTDGQTETRELPPMNVGATLTIRLVAKSGTPVLSGVEIKQVVSPGP